MSEYWIPTSLALLPSPLLLPAHTWKRTIKLSKAFIFVYSDIIIVAVESNEVRIVKRGEDQRKGLEESSVKWSRGRK